MSFEFLYHNRLKNAPKVKDESANRQIRLSENSYKRGAGENRVRRPSEREDEPKDVQDGGSSVLSDDNDADLELPPEVVRYETLSKSSIRRMQELREEIEQGKRYRRENEPDRKKQQNPLEWEKVKGKKGFRRTGSVESEDSTATNSDDLKDFATVRRQLEQNFQRSQSVGPPKGKENEPSTGRSVSFDPNVDVRKIPRDDYPSSKNDYHDMVEELKSMGGKTLVIEPEKRVISTKQQPRADGGIVVSETPRSAPVRREAPTTSHGSYTITTQRPQPVLSPPASPRRTTEPQHYSRDVRLPDSGTRHQTNTARPAEKSSGAGGSWRLVQNGVQADTGEAIPQGARIEYGPDGRMWVYARQEHVQWTTVHLTDNNSHPYPPVPLSPRHQDNNQRPPASVLHSSGMHIKESVPHLTIQQNDADHNPVTVMKNGNIKGRDGKTVIQSVPTMASGARAGVSLSGSTRGGYTDTPSHYQNGHAIPTDHTEEKSINFQSETENSDQYRGYFDRDDSISSSYTSGYRNDVELERVRQGMEMSMDFVDESGGRSRKIPSDEFVGW